MVANKITVQQKFVVMEPITQNKMNFRLIGNAVLFQNVGTTQAVLDNGFTIPAGEARSIHSDNPFVVIAQNISVMFSGVGVNRLEVVILVTTNNPDVDNYIENLTIR